MLARQRFQQLVYGLSHIVLSASRISKIVSGGDAKKDRTVPDAEAVAVPAQAIVADENLVVDLPRVPRGDHPHWSTRVEIGGFLKLHTHHTEPGQRGAQFGRVPAAPVTTT